MIREAKRDAWQEGYDRRDRREPGGTANNPYHENYDGFNNYPVHGNTITPMHWNGVAWERELPVALENEIATLRAELQKERHKVRQYAMAIDAIDATASQFRNYTQNETSK